MQNIKVYSKEDFPSYLPKLNSLYDELFAGGKGFRAKLTQGIAAELGLKEDTTLLLCQTIEFIHNSSLLHDDLVDRSSLRRGKTAAWLKYSPEYAVLAGDYLLARVMVNLSSFGNVELIRQTSQCISDLLEGEWLQDALVGNEEVSLDELTRVHRLKTSSLFTWCLVAPFVAADKEHTKVSETLSEMGDILGILFQRGDDLLDFDIRNNEGKIVLGDLKSKYVNSFCSFIFSNIEPSVRGKAFNAKTLEEFKSIVGVDHFKIRAQAFDNENQGLIDQYNEKLKTLEGEIPTSLSQMLQQLPEPLYWRQSKP